METKKTTETWKKGNPDSSQFFGLSFQ